MSELARRYAEALYDLSPDEESLRATAQAMMADAALWESLRSPAVQAWEKEHILARLPVLEGHGLLLRFYCLLAEKGRMALLPDILEAFHDKGPGPAGCGPLPPDLRPRAPGKRSRRSSVRLCAACITSRMWNLMCASIRPCWAASRWRSRA